MSGRAKRNLALSGGELENKTVNGLQNIFKKSLKQGMHGICFSPYEEGQKPGDQLSEAQIRRKLKIIKSYTKWVRSFSCTDGNELIPKIAKEMNMKTLVGAWLGKDEAINHKEMRGLLSLSEKGLVDIAAVGNEVLYRKEMGKNKLIHYILDTKNSISDHIPVGYVDAYYEFKNSPEIVDACDVILANCYPYWEGCAMEYSLVYMKDMYQQAIKAAKGKKVIITETGWPNIGEGFNAAKPSFENAMKYFINTQQWSREDNIDIFYFSSFDESWKVGEEGKVGAFWGLWDKNEAPKYYIKSFLDNRSKTSKSSFLPL